MSSTQDCYKQSFSPWSEPVYDREARIRSQHILDLVTCLLYILVSIYKQFQKKQTLKISSNCSILWGKGQDWYSPPASTRDCQGSDGKKRPHTMFSKVPTKPEWFYDMEKCLFGATMHTDSPTLWLMNPEGCSLDTTLQNTWEEKWQNLVLSKRRLFQHQKHVLLPRPPPIYSYSTKRSAGWSTHLDQVQEAKERHSSKSMNSTELKTILL